MSYRRFELLALALGLGIVLATVVHSASLGTPETELLGQALLVPVLFLALHYGRSVGFFAAVAATLIYFGANLTFGTTLAVGLFPQAIVVSRAALFGLVGIVGGQLAGHLKYALLRLEDMSLVDLETNSYSRKHIVSLIHAGVDSYRRYGHGFSLVLLRLEWSGPDDQSMPAVSNINQHLKLAAAALKNHVRVVDNVGRWQPKVLCVLAPNTGKAGAQTLAKRITRLVNQSLVEGGERHLKVSVSTETLSFPANQDVIEDMAAS